VSEQPAEHDPGDPTPAPPAEPAPESASPDPAEQRAWRLAVLAGLAYAALLTGVSYYKYAYYFETSFDKGLYTQALHQFARGELYVTMVYTPFLGVHAHYLHFLLTPAVWISAPFVLALVQSVSVAAAGLGVFRFARRRLPSNTALLLCLAYLANPLVHYANLHEYHPELMGTAFLVWALVGIDEERLGWFLGCSLLLILCKESCGLLVVGLAGVAWWRGRPLRFWAPALALGLVGFASGVLVVRAFKENGSHLDHYYKGLGPTLPRALLNLVLHPIDSAEHLLTFRRVHTVVLLLGSFLFLPLRRPLLLLVAAPFLAIPLLGDLPQWHVVYHHYWALPLVCLACASTEALASLRPAWGRRGAVVLLAAALLLHAYTSPLLELPGLRHPRLAAHRKARLDRLLESIPPERGVVAPNNLLSHLADRREVWVTYLVVQGRYNFTYLEQPFPETADYLLIYGPLLTRGSHEGLHVEEWLAEHGEWVLAHEVPEDDLRAYRRRSAPPLSLEK
jgi:uncharacterized membrane protein